MDLDRKIDHLLSIKETNHLKLDQLMRISDLLLSTREMFLILQRSINKQRKRETPCFIRLIRISSELIYLVLLKREEKPIFEDRT